MEVRGEASVELGITGGCARNAKVFAPEILATIKMQLILSEKFPNTLKLRGFLCSAQLFE